MVEQKKRIFRLNSLSRLRVESEISDAVDPARLNFISTDDLVDQAMPNFINLIICEICKGLSHKPV